MRLTVNTRLITPSQVSFRLEGALDGLTTNFIVCGTGAWRTSRKKMYSEETTADTFPCHVKARYKYP